MAAMETQQSNEPTCDDPPHDPSTTPNNCSSPLRSRRRDDSKTNLIINYLPQCMTQKELRSLFGNIGEIHSFQLARDKITGQCLSYGFVEYVDPKDAEKAIDTLNGLKLYSKTIKVSYARPNCATIRDSNLYVSGIPRSMTEEDLEQLFSQFGSIVNLRILMDRQTGISKGVGFVRFNRRAEAEDAMRHLNCQKLPGCAKAISIKFASNPSQKFNQTMMSQTTQPTDQSYSSQFLPMTPEGVPCVPRFNILAHACKSWCIYIYNLAPEADESILWQIFGPFGAVTSVKVVRDYITNKCKGFGFVTMTHYEEAAMAVASLNRYRLWDRVLQVSFTTNRTQ